MRKSLSSLNPSHLEYAVDEKVTIGDVKMKRGEWPE